jgi:hypothetical protein
MGVFERRAAANHIHKAMASSSWCGTMTERFGKGDDSTASHSPRTSSPPHHDVRGHMLALEKRANNGDAAARRELITTMKRFADHIERKGRLGHIIDQLRQALGVRKALILMRQCDDLCRMKEYHNE